MNSCNGDQLAVSIAALASALSCGKTQDELNLLSISLTMLGDAVGVIAVQRGLCDSASSGGTKTIPG